MQKLDRCAVSLSVLALLASCGGSNSTPTGGTPTPSPSATATPTPSPTPTFSYTAFSDLAGDQVFHTGCVESGTPGQSTPIGLIHSSFADSTLISYTEASDTWSVTPITGTVEFPFGPGDLQEQTAELTRYQLGDPNSGGSAFSISTPQLNGDAAVYARHSTSFVGGSINCVFGVATDPDDEPATATVVYDQLSISGLVTGKAANGISTTLSLITGGTGTITGDIATSSATFSLFLNVLSGGVETVVGPFEFSALGEASNDAVGYVAVPDPAANFDVLLSGGFFGPQGEETAFTMVLSEDLTNNGEADRSYSVMGFAKR